MNNFYNSYHHQNMKNNISKSPLSYSNFNANQFSRRSSQGHDSKNFTKPPLKLSSN